MRKKTLTKIRAEQRETKKSTRELVPHYGKLPKDFHSVQATPGTRAYEYTSGKLKGPGLIDDPELLMVIDDKDPQGGLLYVFNDHSSVVWIPTVN
jgi:hypothetical protein